MREKYKNNTNVLTKAFAWDGGDLYVNNDLAESIINENDAIDTVLQVLSRETTTKRVMKYNSKSKILGSNIFLTPIESMILETLAKMKSDPIQPKEMQRIIFNKYSVGITQNNIKVHVCRINKKAKGLIKHRKCFGYYIDGEIKFS